MQPFIGITMNERPDYGADLRYQYYQALCTAGAVPLALPPLDTAWAVPVLGKLDALLLAGGGDMEPRHYGEEPLPKLGETEPHRDMWELALTREAIKCSLPILAICRGMQVLNVALGGSLWQDAAYMPGDILLHKQAEPPEMATQEVCIIFPALAELLGAEHIIVNSHHHQMLRQVAPWLRVAAVAADGVVEAVVPAQQYAGFCLGVQWHPERLDNEDSRRIFAAFATAAREYGLS